MYNFIDVTEASEGVALPSEAMSINGQYIEDLISGYRTLNVSGREALSPDVVEYEVGNRDGTDIQRKRYPSRIIVVNYQLICKSNEEFREAYNQLGKILDVKDAELIFADEQDKFFIGTPCIIDSVSPGRNAVVGKFEILCNDPFKYSLTEYEALASEDGNGILIDYNGTYISRPKLQADFFNNSEIADDGQAVSLTGSGDCGYVAFFTEDEKIIQLGDPEEVDGDNPFPKSQTMMNQLFTGENAWGATAKGLWGLNNGKVLAGAVQTGDVHMGVASTSSYNYTSAGETSQKLASNLVSSQGGVYYTLSAKTSSRTANSVFVNFTISARNGTTVTLGKETVLTASIRIFGQILSVMLKAKSANLAPGASVSRSVSTTFTGLTADQTSLKYVSLSVSSGGSAYGGLSNTGLPDLRISTYSTGTVVYNTGHYLCPLGYSTMSGKWHGPSITRTIGADAAGDVGARDFTLTYKQKMCIAKGKTNQLGAFQVQLNDASGGNICGVRIHKNLSGNEASMLFYINGTKVHGEMIDLSYNNKNFGSAESAVKTSTITKSGGTIVFTVAGIKKTFTVSAVAEKKVEKVTFMFEQWSNNSPLQYNGLYWAKFVKNNCETYRDIPNKFSANDVLVADCASAEIYLNGIQRPDLGAIGNHWEGFVLRPGMNQIGVAHSEFNDPIYWPTFKVRYREVFL